MLICREQLVLLCFKFCNIFDDAFRKGFGKTSHYLVKEKHFQVLSKEVSITQIFRVFAQDFNCYKDSKMFN